jgi:hypothetical protein
MKRLLLALLCLGYAASASAQGTSCDKPNLTGTTNITSPTFLFSVGVPSGQPAPAGFKVTVDGSTTDVGALPPAGVSSSGETCFNATVTVAGNGQHTVTTAFYTLDGGGAKQTSAASAPFVLSLGTVAPTAAPINHPR